jgi:uncharacterized protein (TIGR03437 family)
LTDDSTGVPMKSLNIVSFCSLVLLCGVPAVAANTVTSAITVSMSGTASISPNSGAGGFEGSGSAAGSVSPFGAATSTVSAGGSSTVTFSVTFFFANGSTFGATVSGPDGESITATGSITGGTGALSGATGSLTLTFARSFASETDFTFGFSGSGSMTTEQVGGPPTVTPSAFSFSATQGGAAPVPQNLVVGNPTFTAATYTASASGGSWLSVSQPAGSVAPFSSALIGVIAHPTGLGPGIYTGQVTVAISSKSFTSAVQLVVSPTGQNLSLTQSGLFFLVAAGSSSPPSQTVYLENSGTGTLAGVTVGVTYTESNMSWLSATPSQPNASGNQLAVKVSVNPAGLEAGTYYGQVTFTVPGAANSPLSATVVINVTPGNKSIGGIVLPTGLIFAASLSSSQGPPAQAFTITNLSNQPLTMSTSLDFAEGSAWVVLSQAAGTVAVGQPLAVNVSVNYASLMAGVYQAVIHVMFAEDMSDHPVAVSLIVSGGSLSAPLAEGPQAVDQPRASGACMPTQLVPVFTELGDEFLSTAGWPSPLEVLVTDDCFASLNTGSVIASFSNGDAAVSLVPSGGGQWAGTWVPDGTSSQVTVTVQAQTQTQPLLFGSAHVTGAAAANTVTPILAPGGVVSTASFVKGQPLAPGAFVAIFGSTLAQGANTSTLPFVAQLAGTEGLIGGQTIPLYFTSNGQINAVLPYNITPNSVQQLIVQSNNALSQPESIIISVAQPAVFTQDNSGTGAGSILIQNSAGMVFLATPATPATAGDTLLIFCAGLGAVTPDVPAGAAAPSSPLAMTTNPVTVTVGGQTAQVLFAGLAPGFAGLYQVNATVPSGITAGSDIPVILTVDDISSTPVTVAIH